MPFAPRRLVPTSPKHVFLPRQREQPIPPRDDVIPRPSFLFPHHREQVLIPLRRSRRLSRPARHTICRLPWCSELRTVPALRAGRSSPPLPTPGDRQAARRYRVFFRVRSLLEAIRTLRVEIHRPREQGERVVYVQRLTHVKRLAIFRIDERAVIPGSARNVVEITFPGEHRFGFGGVRIEKL